MSQYTSYYLYQKYVSYDNGTTWVPVYPEEYSISGDSSDPQTITKKQDNDPECGYTPPVIPQYRWVQDGDNYICDDCGYTPTPQYRTISGTPYCTGYDKMVDTQYQVSYDSGSTWSTVSSSTLTVEHDSVDCGYVPPTPPSSGYANQYFTVVGKGNGQIRFSGSTSGSSTNTLQYSTNSGSTWTTASSSITASVSSGQTIMFKGTCTPMQYNGIGRFSASTSFDVEGNIMSLLYGDNFSGQTSLEGKNYAFYELFNSCATLQSAENLVLPATTLANSCYALMFYGCSSLTTAPALPATTLANYCYGDMFNGCTNLTTAPTLHATTLATYCYSDMFGNCTNLTTAPELPATTLASFCYYYMFENCTSLTTAPSTLPATTLADYCYMAMFLNCTNLSSITCLATDISATRCTADWVYNVARSGTFTKASSMSSWTTGNDGIPSNWTVQDYQG